MYEVIGIRSVDIPPRDGQPANKGRSIYFKYDDDNVDGMAADRIFLSDSRFSSLYISVGDIIDIRYNRYGKVQSVDVVR